MSVDKALLIIDVQKDFCTGGILPARDTLSLIGPLNKMISWSIDHGIICIFTRDWHPANHCSFVDQGGPWPPHCVQGSTGAEFAHGLLIPKSSLVIDIEKDPSEANLSYSAFENTNLDTELHKKGVVELFVTGIATDYCVKATVMDALKCNFKVKVLTDLTRPIDVQPNDSFFALEEMKAAGACLAESRAIRGGNQ